MTGSAVGQKVNLEGIELYYEYIKSCTDNLTIVFESGYGWDLNNWNSIKNDVSKFANVFFYDRDGIGRSEKSSKPKHSMQIINNLRNLLKEAEVKPPYLLVGHSFGGVNARLFANRYPEEVAGVILLDSVHEEQNKKMVPLFTEKVQKDYLGQFAVEATLSEFEESLEQVKGIKLGEIPLLVITGGTQSHHTNQSMAQWMMFQKELANLSTTSNHLVIKEAGHAVHIDEPQLVINAIKEMKSKL
ncbi:2-hydroxy-6-oxononatrienedioate hydrolase [[Bacillus] enclensis]|uniref:Pimeloyl-ACP methyl ester carboxylesterase n=1 Tax=[Bacillus] enclensis TaxID=1402860 RepID=A0A0V8HKU8_9BACI|nr:alpha/beta hydrolase [[Bacillus] enclensis]KSU63166.1 2-hydroxy-6-oxononatrienedioate hydrolase [[Bacillus] enclensis]KSU64688.1 2-hydroxy-6-oxononatrienedioate hydrolase [[Bacillus] enclensis]SCB78438.1 Pimeloyl-ACP methyl ester carboxylesterase [[Bacillus] enclensis]SCB79478.1 Pimeloyl-ACP methyl ester carboxylesterase [[Bacillus] enclensis]